MRILAIETSCDETAIAIIEKKGAHPSRKATEGKAWDFRVLANLVSSQVKIHEKFGGVVPNLARREHEKNLVPIVLKALKEAKLLTKKRRMPDLKQIENTEKILERELELKKKFKKDILPRSKPKLDAIAVTYGPGLAPALWAGVNFAKALSSFWRLPLLPVNHMEGHIFSALFDTKHSKLKTMRLPAIALLVSGGHTELHLVKKLGAYRRLGETLDDAAGEAFDKVAKMLGLPYPGGPEISKQAGKGNLRAIAFPRPMINSNNYNFSFSGLKTSVLYYLRDRESLSLRKVSRSTSGHGSSEARERGRESSGRASRWESETPSFRETSLSDVAASFEQAVVDVLIEKTMRAAKQYKAKTILVGGGVAANKKLRTELNRKISENLPEIELLMPAGNNTGDNALMIALAAVYGEQGRTGFSYQKKIPRNFGAEPGLKL